MEDASAMETAKFDKSKVEVYICHMIDRAIESKIRFFSKEYPVVAVIGPRQSGKTTLVQKLFPRHKYISLENIAVRNRAIDDPNGFLDDNDGFVIFDEVQRVPDLFSYLQERVDADQRPGRYVLTGSHQFLLMENISQTLAGRIIICNLFPFSIDELYGCKPANTLEDILKVKKDRQRKLSGLDVADIVFSGLFPRIHDKQLDARKWLESYVNTYLEKDIRSLVNVSDLRTFESFLRVCAYHSGQLINYASISNRIGVSQPTIKKWISLLETSGAVFIMKPYYKNFSKRIIKTPKLFFIDTGLLCFLLGIRSRNELFSHPLWGNIFETFIISEIYKRCSHLLEIPPMYFWRDQTGNEIDLLLELGSDVIPVEIKSSKTYHPEFKDAVYKWMGLKGNNAHKGVVLYNGDEVIGKTKPVSVIPWWMI